MLKCKDKVIITISRAFGSGGREIGKKVAEELAIPFYDKELLEVQAKDGRYSIGDLNRFDEKEAGSVFYSVAFNPYMHYGTSTIEKIILDIQENAIKTIAEQGSCVIIGRRADKILRSEYDILSVFVSAPLDKRIARVSDRMKLYEKDSKRKIKEADRERRAFYNAHGEGEWGEAESYNLCIDSGSLGVKGSAAMIIKYLELKEKIERAMG